MYFLIRDHILVIHVKPVDTAGVTRQVYTGFTHQLQALDIALHSNLEWHVR